MAKVLINIVLDIPDKDPAVESAKTYAREHRDSREEAGFVVGLLTRAALTGRFLEPVDQVEAERVQVMKVTADDAA